MPTQYYRSEARLAAYTREKGEPPTSARTKRKYGQSEAKRAARPHPAPARAGRPAPRPLPGPDGRPRPAGGSGVETATLAGILLFLLGGTWDVAWHIEIGRDTFWSPPHLLLYTGILIILGASAAGFVRAWRQGHRSGRRLPGASTVIIAIGGVLALASGPVDDLWHRLYGLDVTILSPPHIQLIGGVALAAFGALAGFAWRANRAVPARLATLWPATRLGARPWARGETGLYAAAGLLLALFAGVLSEYDFDVSRYPVTLHPVLLAGLSAVVLTAAVRAGGRVGGATLTAAVYTLVRLLAQLELILLTGVRPQIPLLLVAAPVLDVALWGLTRLLAFDAEASHHSDSAEASRAALPRHTGRTWLAAPIAGALYAAALLLVEWPYTTASGTIIWSPSVLATAALPAILAGAAGALLGWGLGAALRPLPAIAAQPAAPGPASAKASRRVPRVAPVRTTARPLVVVALAGVALLAFWVLPTVANAGALPSRSSSRSAGPSQSVVGTLALDPAVPVVGQPLTVRLTVTDPFLITSQPLIPFESVRAGDIVEGNLQAGSQPGVYQATFTPKEPGRRWLSAFINVEEVRTAATASFVVYPPSQAATQAPQGDRSVILRPEPGPDPSAPGWLQRVAVPALIVLFGAAGAGAAAALRAERRRPRPSPSPA